MAWAAVFFLLALTGLNLKLLDVALVPESHGSGLVAEVLQLPATLPATFLALAVFAVPVVVGVAAAHQGWEFGAAAYGVVSIGLLIGLLLAIITGVSWLLLVGLLPGTGGAAWLFR